MRDRERVVQSLESVYRSAFEQAEARADDPAMQRLDFEFQRDQLHLEVMLDIRDLLAPSTPEDKESSLLDKAQALRRMTRLR